VGVRVSPSALYLDKAIRRSAAGRVARGTSRLPHTCGPRETASGGALPARARDDSRNREQTDRRKSARVKARRVGEGGAGDGATQATTAARREGRAGQATGGFGPVAAATVKACHTRQARRRQGSRALRQMADKTESGVRPIALPRVSPRSSADRALASGARGAGSSPAGGTGSFGGVAQMVRASGS
jgi:hypothetical protein